MQTIAKYSKRRLLTVGPCSKMENWRELVPSMYIPRLHPRLISHSWHQAPNHIPHFLHGHTGIRWRYILLWTTNPCSRYHNTIPFIPVADDGGPIGGGILMTWTMMARLLAVKQAVFGDGGMAIHRPGDVVRLLVRPDGWGIEHCQTGGASEGEQSTTFTMNVTGHTTVTIKQFVSIRNFC